MKKSTPHLRLAKGNSVEAPPLPTFYVHVEDITLVKVQATDDEDAARRVLHGEGETVGFRGARVIGVTLNDPVAPPQDVPPPKRAI